MERTLKNNQVGQLDWGKELRQAIRTPQELALHLDLPEIAAIPSNSKFPLVVTHSFMRRMRKGDISDPLLRQVLVTLEEDVPSLQALVDPVGDINARKEHGLLHKYENRALLMTTSACAVHCRYCFRRNFPYQDEIPQGSNAWSKAFAYISQHPEINEVILSGGDPLSLSEQRLAQLLMYVKQSKQIKYLRIHTRMPIVLPNRVNLALINMLNDLPQKIVIVLHINHANELDSECENAIELLKQADITLLNQAVLLKGVNDSLEAQCNLSEALFAKGILPYYLHRLDKVQGGMHFEVPEYDGIALIKAMQAKLPGYLVPKFVREDAGAASKTLIT